MKVLVIKTSSLGDVLHTLPALSDARRALPQIQFHWAVEEAFAQIPSWHAAVETVIPVAIRRWRRKPWQWGTLQQWRRALQSTQYDLIIDAQGLLKSAWLAWQARGRRVGLSWSSARESLAALTYHRRIAVPWGQHAVVRVRQLFAKALGYDMPTQAPDYGLDVARLGPSPLGQGYLVCLHGTTWETKHWPESHWRDLLTRASAAGLTCYLPWGNALEQARAQRLCEGVTGAYVLPAMTLVQLAAVLAHARAVVAVDTGLGHMAAALAVPTVSVYGPTDPLQTGTMGPTQWHVQPTAPDCAPCLQTRCTFRGASAVKPACFAQVDAQAVWQHVEPLLDKSAPQVFTPQREQY